MGINKRAKIMVILLAISILVLSTGITYSYFTSGATITSNQALAKFNFNSELSDAISIPIIDLVPGDIKTYTFGIANGDTSENRSDVNIEYRIIIKTFGTMPLDIKLSSLDGEEKEVQFTCNEGDGSRTDVERICASSSDSPYLLEYLVNEENIYELEVNYPDTYSDSVYSKLVDYIEIELNSWQKVD